MVFRARHRTTPTFPPRMNVDFEQATPGDAEDLVKVQIAAFHDDARIYPGVEIGGPPG